MSSPALRTERLRLRPWREADKPAFAALNADPAVMEHFPRPLTQAESDTLADRIAADITARGWGLWAVEVVGGAPFIGFVGLSIPRWEAPFTPCVEVGWRLARAHWGQGYATEAAHAAVEFGFGEVALPRDEILSFTTTRNLKSQRVMERIGMLRDAAGDFDHPLCPDWDERRHVLYRMRRPVDVASRVDQG